MCESKEIKSPITAIILTYNERNNLTACIESIYKYVNSIIVTDSFSNDGTIKIAEKFTNKIYHILFINQAKQFIWTIENADIKNEWILRIDADERWTPRI